MAAVSRHLADALADADNVARAALEDLVQQPDQSVVDLEREFKHWLGFLHDEQVQPKQQVSTCHRALRRDVKERVMTTPECKTWESGCPNCCGLADRAGARGCMAYRCEP